jgi:hypothetical protein
LVASEGAKEQGSLTLPKKKRKKTDDKTSMQTEKDASPGAGEGSGCWKTKMQTMPLGGTVDVPAAIRHNASNARVNVISNESEIYVRNPNLKAALLDLRR